MILRDVSFTYLEGETVLKNIDLTVEEGEFVAITGRTGSAKSTLSHVLSGLIPHSINGQLEGEVILCGLDTREVPLREISQRVGIVFQNAESQLVGLTVEEDVQFGLENLGLPRDKILQRTQWAIERVRLQGFDHQSPWTLSGGQKQRVAIASVLAMKPQVMILDNPTAELDPIGKREILETIYDLNKNLGITIIIFEQENEEIVSMLDRVVVLDRGMKILEGSPRQIFSDTDRLISLGIKVPQVTELTSLLRRDGHWHGEPPILLEEAIPLYREILPARGAVPEPPTKRLVLGEPVIEVKDINYEYMPGKKVLDGISMTIRQGEFMVVMGPNGSGKTTLAKHLNGLLRPTSGTVQVNGTLTTEATVAELSQRVGYVFQNPDHQIFNKTVGEELAFGPKNLGWDSARVEQAIDRIIEEVQLNLDKDADPFFIGIAERKLLAIASTLIMEPEVLILDEPATGADWTICLKIMEYVKNLHERGLTIVIITHDVHVASIYADRVAVINEGKVVIDGPTEEVLTDEERLKSCFVKPPQVHYLFKSLADRGLPSRILTTAKALNVIEGVLRREKGDYA